MKYTDLKPGDAIAPGKNPRQAVSRMNYHLYQRGLYASYTDGAIRIKKKRKTFAKQHKLHRFSAGDKFYITCKPGERNGVATKARYYFTMRGLAAVTKFDDKGVMVDVFTKRPD